MEGGFSVVGMLVGRFFGGWMGVEGWRLEGKGIQVGKGGGFWQGRWDLGWWGEK